MKKLVSLCVALALGLAVTGCETKTATPPAGGSKPAGGATESGKGTTTPDTGKPADGESKPADADK